MKKLKPLTSQGSVIRKAVIPAAGYGTRFLPMTKASPKEMMPIIDQQLEQSMQPPPPDPMVELKRQEVTAKIRAEVARIETDHIRAMAEVARAANDARTAESEEAKNESQAILNLAKAQEDAIGSNFATLKAQVTQLEQESVSEQGLAERVIANVNATRDPNQGA